MIARFDSFCAACGGEIVADVDEIDYDIERDAYVHSDCCDNDDDY